MSAEQLRDLLNGLVSRKDVAHAVVAVERGDRSFRWIGAAGHANPDGTPMLAETPYFVASVDKLFTAAVVLQLYEAGMVRLDEPVAAYLPAALVAGLHRLDGVDYTESITVSHLLGHTSGLADYIEDFPKGGRSLIGRIAAEGDFAWTRDEALALVRERLAPHFPPQPTGAKRQKARYSDTNYLLLKALIEQVTGQPLHAVMGERIFRPLNLRQTWVAGYSTPAVPTPTPAALWLGRRPLVMPLAMRSLWSVYSTADDMLRFMRGLMSGGPFTDPATLPLMQRRWKRFGFPFDRAALRAPSWPIEYGLGLMRFRLPRLLTPFQPVPAVVGHTGSTGSWLFHCPELDLFLSGTVDQVTAGAVPFRFVPKLLRAIMS